MFKICSVVLVHAVNRAVEGSVKKGFHYVGVVLGSASFSGVEHCSFDSLLFDIPHHSSGIKYHTNGKRERERRERERE